MNTNLPHVVFVFGEPDGWRQEWSRQLAHNIGWAVLAVQDMCGDGLIKQRIQDLASGGDASLIVHCNQSDARQSAALMKYIAAGNCGILPCKIVCLVPQGSADSPNDPCLNFAKEVKLKLNVNEADLMVIQSDPGDADVLGSTCAKIASEMLEWSLGDELSGKEGLLGHTGAALDDLLNFQNTIWREVRALQEEVRTLKAAKRGPSHEEMESIRKEMSSELREHIKNFVQRSELREHLESFAQKSETSRIMEEMKSEQRDSVSKARALLSDELETASLQLRSEFAAQMLTAMEGKVREIKEDRKAFESRIGALEGAVGPPGGQGAEARERGFSFSGTSPRNDASPMDLSARVAKIESQLRARSERLQQLVSGPRSRSPTPPSSRSPTPPPSSRSPRAPVNS